jgi:glutaryl-CoA dehydrogenase
MDRSLGWSGQHGRIVGQGGRMVGQGGRMVGQGGRMVGQGGRMVGVAYRGEASRAALPTGEPVPSASASTPTPLELLAVDGLLDDEERAVRDTVRRFCDDKIRPHIADWFEDGQLPARELAKELGALGLLGMHLEGYGCAGTSATAYGLACIELEAADSGIRSLVSVQGSLAMFAIHHFGSEDQRTEWLPSMATGDAIGCFGLTEADFGSNPGGMRTRARRDGGDWVLDGTKMWITNGSIADVAVVWARTDDGIRGFVVPTDTPGFSAPEIHQKMSLRASVTSELVLEGVRLPESAMLPEAAGLAGPLSCLSEARFGIVFGSLGAARDCLEATIAYAKSRLVFDKPLAAYQLTQEKLANMTVELGKGMLLALHLGRLKDAGEITGTQVSIGKLNNVRESLAIARECRTILAANGITLEYPVIRHANNLESVLTYEGTSEVHQLVIGQALTGESAFR